MSLNKEIQELKELLRDHVRLSTDQHTAMSGQLTELRTDLKHYTLAQEELKKDIRGLKRWRYAVSLLLAGQIGTGLKLIFS